MYNGICAIRGASWRGEGADSDLDVRGGGRVSQGSWSGVNQECIKRTEATRGFGGGIQEFLWGPGAVRGLE